MKTQIIAKMIAASLMTITLASANVPTNFSPTLNEDLTSVDTIYQTMSTSQLQKEIERCSKNGEVTFAMGMELMKRWSKS